MFVHVKSTRHTKIGTLRRGVVYAIDENNQAARSVVAAHTGGDNPAMKKVSAAEAKKLATKMVSLDLEDGSPTLSEDADELSAQFEAMTGALKAAEEQRDAEAAKVTERDAKIDELTSALEDAEKQRDDVIAQASEQKAKIDELQAMVAEKDDQKPKQDGKK
ncbi:hypothetical protein [Thioclava sp. DLFJ4-1]|uniref:hypothetical protein n=1 Tax=Thioclava sp. DLFJ4-1 TaxID=1915313 RepID=UPI0009978D6F|nr:hypothetical protein [Thioclava sp. DLFJ4-1]OOY16724.1 hypothetical protein BMI85_06565 [Thioclava sp. DLFJ4-1]